MIMSDDQLLPVSSAARRRALWLCASWVLNSETLDGQQTETGAKKLSQSVP